ncbi:MAG TPA: EAL domain-containing protein [Noviherbaspirillum sp.]|uniref:EAL domain-containing protein n=1 Tax=Noviherbaspirillum sp. TaxID=1926288 RepID=UPI002D3572B8|nr:EAL domain-containing protein [Noviherbaspirillum sp.]HYD97312.1 EAL domain-containing protein [Noviherbaspirillum sp.]
MADDVISHPSHPADDIGTPASTISKKIAAVFCVLFVVAVANIVVVRTMLDDVNGVAETMNVAGRLRMLSQKAAFDATRALQSPDAGAPDLPASLEAFDDALAVLIHGGDALGYRIKPLSSRHLPLLEAIRSDWMHFRSLVEASGVQPAAPRIAEDAAKLLGHAENLVSSLTREAQQAQEKALMKMYGLLFIDLLVLLAVFAAVRRRIVRPLRELAQRSRELAEGNYRVSIDCSSDDEIGMLASRFNESAQRIGELVGRIERDRTSLKQAESMFRGFAENSVVGVYIAQNGRFRFVNPKMAQMFGYTQDEMAASVTVYDLVAESDREVVAENVRKRLRGEAREVHYERRARRKDGALFDVEVFGSLMKLDGEHATIGIMLDISERKRLDLALRVLSACNQALVRATDETALLNEICFIIRDISGFPFAWVGFAEDGPQKKVRPAAMAEIEEGALVETLRHVSWDDAATGRGATGTAIREGRVVVVRDMQTSAVHAPWRDFMVRYEIVSAMSLPLRAGNRILGALSIYSHEANAFGPNEVKVAEELADNLAYGIAALRAEAARRRYAEQLEYHAAHDILTGLPNRALLQDRLTQALAYASRYCYAVWVLFLDLDRFKLVNDSLGHKAGDIVLQSIAARLEAAVRETDTVARLGGDEFVLVLPERADECLTSAVVQRIMDAVAQPLEVDGHEFVLGCSIGVAAYPSDGEDPETLIKHADIAMYRAKETGRNNFQFYTPAMNERLMERLRIESDLRNALERGEFVLHYQPQIDLRTGSTIGMEALIRWQHPTLGMVPPLRFISLAEETGLIVPIGQWVLRTACTQAVAWQNAGLGKLRVAVNLSARQFAEQDLVSSIAGVLASTGLAPHLLELELTESLVMTDVDRAIGILRDLKQLGVLLSLDDFGTGHSSLSYLKRLPIDALKIDQSFVRDITHTADDAAIVASIISLAHNLRRHVIAEGVETHEQLAYLQRHGCNEMQGYYFSKPVPAELFEKLLRIDSGAPAGWVRPAQTGAT